MIVQRYAVYTGIAGLLVHLGCATSTPPTVTPIEPEPTNTEAKQVKAKSGKVYTVHLGPAWYKFRASGLGITVEEAKQRDDAISDREPPPGFWDAQIATEAAAIWGALCNDCHGGRRRVSEARSIKNPTSDWGRSTGYFFGRGREHARIFRTIYNGGEMKDEQPSEMPAWGGRLAREQIWAVVYYIEYQSGGVSGPFPPGLYPQRSQDSEEERFEIKDHR